jgi:hypothetical protein
MPRKKKEQDDKPLNIRTIQQIRDEKAIKKTKEKFIDYNSDTLAARRDDIIKLIDDNAKNFEKDSIELKKEFLKALCYGNPIRTTAQVLGIGRQRIYDLKKKDPAFAACVDDIVKDLEFAKVTDIENELLEIKDVFLAVFADLYNNGLFLEAVSYQKEANRISERFIDRYYQRKAREEDLQLRIEEMQAIEAEERGQEEPQKAIFDLPNGYKALPNNLSDPEND